MYKFFLFLVLTILTLTSFSQEIKNIRLHKNPSYIQIEYTLEAENPSTIRVFHTVNREKKTEITYSTEGDAGAYIKPGPGKQIKWQPKDTNLIRKSSLSDIFLEAGPFVETILVQGGSFDMGCTEEQIKCDGDEKRVHKVTLSSYYLSKYEITNAQYSAFLNDIGADPIGTYKRDDYIHITKPSCMINYEEEKFVPQKGKENFPAIEVTWFGAQAFSEWLGGRLPTEAEWEYAARGGRKSQNYIYSGSNKVEEVAWYDQNSREKLREVGLKKPNELGFYDMSGNVWEWCYDWYDRYPRREQTNPLGPDYGYGKVIRGGSYLYYGRFCRVANRGSSTPAYCFNNYGFRIYLPAE